MSEHSKILEKYEKMFETGEAYKPIRINQPMPSMSEAMGGGGRSEIPLGEQVNRGEEYIDPHADYSEFDASMQARVDAIRNRNPHNNNSNVSVQNNGDYAKLEKRIEMLEQALSLVMETQTRLLKEKKNEA